MKRSKLIFALLAISLLPLAVPPAAHAQARPRPAQMRRMVRRQRAEARMRPGRVPQRWIQRLQRMSPQEQERFLENNRRFRSLPPRRQAEIRARLKQWDRLTPEQKRILIRRARIFERMSPAERREIRQVILPEWRRLPPARRRIVKQKLRQLQGLNESQREKRLNDPRFNRGLSPKERNLLDQLAKLRVGPGPRGN
jgi:hypothetical protein